MYLIGVIQLIFVIIIIIAVIGGSLEDPGCEQCQGSYCIFCSNNSYNRGLLDNIKVFFRTAIHSLLNLFGFHDTTDSRYNKDKHHTKELVSHDVVTERLQENKKIDESINHLVASWKNSKL